MLLLIKWILLNGFGSGVYVEANEYVVSVVEAFVVAHLLDYGS
jgi:hypothetical protein